jgi:hypothetical protein
MSEKEYNNTFRFALYQGNVLLCEKIFDADKFNPFTRYSINIREILPRAITKLQKTLSKKKYDIIFDCGNNAYYDLYHYTQNLIDSYPQKFKNDLRYSPQAIVQQIEDKTIRGVECKIGFYINENPIVERLFYVDGYNPVARWSVDLLDSVIEITDIINDKIRKIDIKNMWDDYDLINMKGLTINQIREFTPQKRDEMLRRIKRY